MKLKIGSTYQKAVTIVEKLKEGNASIFICGKSGVGKSTLSYDIIRGLLESGVRIVVIDHRHAVSLPTDLGPCVHHQDVSQKPLKLHLFGASDNPADAAASFADTITSVIALSNTQKQLLRSLLKEVLRASPAPNEVLEYLHQEIKSSHSRSAPGLENALAPIFAQKLFEDGDIEFSPGITLLDLSSFSLSTQHIVEEVLFAALLREATREDFSPTFLYLDELSNYTLRSSNALGRILCEGRKQGLYALLVAQSIRVFKSEQRILLQQCKYMMCFQPADEEVRMCARLISSSGGTKLTSMLKSLQVGEFMVSGPVYVGDSDTPTTKPLVVHTLILLILCPGLCITGIRCYNGPLAIPVPSDTEPILPPAQIDLLLPLDALDDCDDEEAAPSKPETVTENACPLLPDSPSEPSIEPLHLRDKSFAPQEQSQSQQLQLLRSAVFTSVPMNSYYGNYNCSWPPAQVQPATFSYPNMDFSSLIQQDDAQISFQALITP